MTYYRSRMDHLSVTGREKNSRDMKSIIKCLFRIILNRSVEQLHLIYQMVSSIYLLTDGINTYQWPNPFLLLADTHTIIMQFQLVITCINWRKKSQLVLTCINSTLQTLGKVTRLVQAFNSELFNNIFTFLSLDASILENGLL